MPRTLFDHLSPDTGAKRILALDGGGVKGLLTLGMLKVMEDELRRRAGGDRAFRLCDYYDLIGGASFGAIIAAGLALGMSIDELIALYLRMGHDVFGRHAGDGFFQQTRINANALRRALQSVFTNRTFGSQDLRTGLAMFAKRIDTGATWVLTNHPLDPNYDPDPEHGAFPHKSFRLADLVLASSSAPSYFDAVVVGVAFDDHRRPVQRGYFVDGAAGAGNNPSVQLLLLALMPEHRFGWKAGAENLMMSSFGAGARQPAIGGATFQSLPPATRAAHTLRAMIYETQVQGVAWMQALSKQHKPWAHESGGAGTCILSAPLLDFQRVDVVLDVKPKPQRRTDPAPPMTALERMLGRELDAETLTGLDRIDNGAKKNMELLLEVGGCAGRVYIDACYPDSKFDLPEWRAG